MTPRLTMIALVGSRPGRTTPQRLRDGSISPRLAAKRGVAQNERFVKILDAGQANAAGRRRRKTTAIAATSFPVLRSIVVGVCLGRRQEILLQLIPIVVQGLATRCKE